jgi:HAD superfamily hydrolase (TIGR01549 family)
MLFDLDDTLLGNDMDVFLPHYFSLCGHVAQKHMPQEKFIQSMLLASRSMIANTDPDVTIDEVFWSRFGEITGLDRDLVAADFDNFYRNEFVQMRDKTEHKPLAAQIMDWCFGQDLKVVIATNPMFPRIAIEARLDWAGVPVKKYSYALVTTMENMHATKPHAAYYYAILDEVGCRPDEALMIGDDGMRDIEPAAKLGLFTYWIALPEAELPQGVSPTAQGNLEDLAGRLNDGWLSTLTLEKSS